MPFLNSPLRHHLQTQLTAFFPQPGLYYIHAASSSEAARWFQDYHQAITAAVGKRNLGLIAFPDTGLVPYLSVRSNILINRRGGSRRRWLQRLPLAADWLDADIETLSASEALYVQLYRGLVANQPFLLMRDFPSTMSPHAIRQFITHAQHAIQLTATKLIILTTDATLVAAHPETSWLIPPRFSDETA